MPPASILFNRFHLIFMFAEMGFEYRSLEAGSLNEKPSRESTDSSATLHALDELDLSLQDSESGFLKTARGQSAGIFLLRSGWIWVAHAILLFISCGMLALSLITSSTTLDHVRRFSAWCKHFRFE
jgi:hypothetical protein